jgi:invasion protein IalB
MDRAITRSGLAACLAALACLPAAAQDGLPPWLVSCQNRPDPGRLDCELAQSIVTTQNNQRVATVALRKAAGQEGVTAALTFPVGAYLPAGWAATVDGNPVADGAFLSCDVQGCYAEAPADAAWLDAMRSGTDFTLSIDRMDRQSVEFTFPLDGFAAALDLMP